MSDSISKFQNLLRELFQFDCADLDFGIYRIMNQKRDVIERFITVDLPGNVNDELNRGALTEQTQAAVDLEETAQQIRTTLTHDAIDDDGNLVKFKDTDIGKRYLELTEKAHGDGSRDALESVVFNHLYAFFSRYYQDGDFISKPRYSKRHRYAIPYNGEEVHLHWANKDQYYVKTGEHFRDYSFQVRDVTVHFKLQAADVEQDNVKGEKRFFLPSNVEPTWDEDNRRLQIGFEFRPLTSQEEITYGNKNQQEAILAEAVEKIPSRLEQTPTASSALTTERRNNGDGESVSFLEHHLKQYTRRNTSDYFIHKDLKGFLDNELDFFLKNEVLILDEVEMGGEVRAEGWFQLMRTIRTVGCQIIEFLNQIENFQKLLWEKRKFVTETQYCVSIGQVNNSFYDEISRCEAQWEEWKALLDISTDHTDLFDQDSGKAGKRIEFLQNSPTLPLDTKHFDEDFVDRLLGSFEDLDCMTDGLLINGENHQALSLMQSRYRKQVKCVYIDPPFNTSETSLLYKNEYRHSTWVSLIEQGVLCAKRMLNEESVFSAAIDDFENENLSKCLESVFGPTGRLGTLVVETKPSGRTNDRFLASCHEYYHFFGLPGTTAQIRLLPLSEEARAAYGEVDEIGAFRWRDFLRTGGFSTPEERPNSFYPIYYNPASKEASLEYSSGSVKILPLDSEGKQRVWRKTPPSFLDHVSKGEIKIERRNSGTWKVLLIDRIKDGTRPKSVWVGSRYDAASHGTKLLKKMFGDVEFGFPKALWATQDVLYVTLGEKTDGVVLDYFAGSGTTGHAVINLNREDGGRRVFILIEMGDHFDTVLLPRIKKATFTPEWTDGKPKRIATQEEAHRSPRIVKYMRLESYEDVLNNIDFDDASGQQALQFNDYLLKYMLRWETKRSTTLLNVEKLSRPFNYILNIHVDGQTRQLTADIPETFNYLIGLCVEIRRVYNDDNRRYVVYRGRIEQRRVVVIWRETYDWTNADLERDRTFVDEQRLIEGADEVYVNGDSLIREAKALEPEFKRRMFAEAQK